MRMWGYDESGVIDTASLLAQTPLGPKYYAVLWLDPSSVGPASSLIFFLSLPF